VSRLYTVKGKRVIGKNLTLETAAEIAIDAGGHMSIIDESTGAVVIEDADGEYMTIGATEKLLLAYEISAPEIGAFPKKLKTPEPKPPERESIVPTRPRFMAAPKRKSR